MSELKTKDVSGPSPLLPGKKNHSNGFPVKKIGFMSTMVLPIATGSGAAIIILPHDLKTLGPVIFVIFTFFIVLLLTFVGVLFKEIFTCLISLTKEKDAEDLTLPKLSSLFINKKFAVIVKVVFYLVMALVPVCCSIIAATLLSNIFPIDVPYYQRIRIWVVPCFILVTPMTFTTSLAETQRYTLLGVVACVIATLTVYGVCLKHCITQSVDMSDFLDTDTFASPPQYFRTFGHLLFLSSNIYLPVLIINYRKPKLFELPLFLSSSLLFCSIALSASIPYAAFRQHVDPNLFDTLHKVMTDEVVIGWLLVIARLLFAVYFIGAGVLPITILFQSIEEAVKMPKEITCIKILSHITLMSFFLAAAVLFPFMEPMITLTGSIPICVIGITIPILLYYFMTYKLSLCMKVVLVAVGMGTFLCSLATMYFSLRDLFVLFNKEYYNDWHKERIF